MNPLKGLLVVSLILLTAGCGVDRVTQDPAQIEEWMEQPEPQLYIVLTLDAEEKDDLLGIHGGIMDGMLDIFEEEGLGGKVEILMPVDDWEAAVEDNLTVVQRINESYPISLHCDRHARFTFQDREEQEKRIFSSIAWIKGHFDYSGMVFRAPTLMEGETTRDVLDEAGIDYDLTPQIYASQKTPPFFPVLVRENLNLLPTTVPGLPPCRSKGRKRALHEKL
jgi:peptidoglycan/xylan/chitin deacetylase (PgdA/CDA1 family)